MKLAIMQPYLFPYIGYFQLVQAADKFVIYDDVNFIKQGWINRNRILFNAEPLNFTVPLKNTSSFATIANTEINYGLYEKWKIKFIKTLVHAYGKAPYFANAFPIIESVLDKSCSSVSELAGTSIKEVCRYINIDIAVEDTSAIYANTSLHGAVRLIDICRQESASTYINPIGGTGLYTFDEFSRADIELQFIKTGDIVYPQFKNTFISHLSIIDVMMFNSPDMIRSLLGHYTLLSESSEVQVPSSVITQNQPS